MLKNIYIVLAQKENTPLPLQPVFLEAGSSLERRIGRREGKRSVKQENGCWMKAGLFYLCSPNLEQVIR
ncbi:hypothetical protein, partial [Schleiferia thermophila]